MHFIVDCLCVYTILYIHTCLEFGFWKLDSRPPDSGNHTPVTKTRRSAAALATRSVTYTVSSRVV